MTAIAALTHRGHAILYGDCRVTVASEEPHRRLPTTDDPEFFVPRYYLQQIYDLIRKIYIISPSLAVGVAGNYLYASALLTDLRKSVTPVGIAGIQDFLTSYRTHVYRDLSVIGAVADGGKSITFRFDFDTGIFDSGGEYARGDGGWLFRDMITKGASFVDRIDINESIIANVTAALGFFLF